MNCDAFSTAKPVPLHAEGTYLNSSRLLAHGEDELGSDAAIPQMLTRKQDFKD